MIENEYFCELGTGTNTILQIYLFRNVKNVEYIRNNIINGSWKCAVIKPSLILDPFQIAVAANRAVVSEKNNTMVTRTVFTEILYNLSLTKNITQSLKKFGIEKDKDLLVCFIKTPDSNYGVDILPEIDGDKCAINELSGITDLNKIKNVYQLNDLEGTDLLDVILSRMVTKHFISY